MTVIDRSRDLYTEGPWTLTDLLPEADDRVLDERLSRLGSLVDAFEAHRGRLGPELTTDGLLAILADYREIVEEANVLSGYGSLWFSSDTQSKPALAFRDRVRQALTELFNRMVFFTVWWRRLDEDRAAELLPDPETHGDERHWLEENRRIAPYTLDETSEQIINLKDANGSAALVTLYSMLTNRLEFHLEVDGEEKTLTRDGLMSYAYSSDPDLRRAAYEELFRVYTAESGVLGQIYVHLARDWDSENVELRGMPAPISARNLSNDVPDEAVDVLLDVCRENRTVFHRYFRLKAGWLGRERLRRVDLYAPVATSEEEIPWDEAVREVLDTFERFEPRMAQLARRVFEENHVDSELRKGKRNGAMCATILPRLTPWVLINYTGKLRDVATLAHELGHAVHSMLAADHSVLTQQPSLPLAETASVFGEILVTERLLERVDDPLARREILAKTMDDIYATVLRQTYFVRFEREAHDAVRRGRSVDHLDELYRGHLDEQFGDSVEVPDMFRHEWVVIPHIFQTPFYCYAYAFGQLLVLALYRRYQQEGEAFKPGYLRLLAHGGSAEPEAILAEAGFDLRDPDFWRGGFRVVEEMVEELEGLEL